MKAFSAALALILIAVPLAAQTYTPESFDDELARIDREIESSISPQLPDRWQVRAGTREYSISTAPLRSFFRGANGSSPDEARAWIAATRRDLGSFSGTRAPSKPAQTELDEILARAEFKPPPPPSAMQQLWKRFRDWAGDILSRIFDIAAQHPTEARLFFWAIIMGIIMLLGWWLSKFFRPPTEGQDLPTPTKAVLLKSWQEWMRSARAAAARGAFREAIHDGYWAGIARLQLERTIQINLSDTPRERLHSVTESTRRYQPLPASELASLTAVTDSFERVWYADLPATAEDVDRAFVHLETLGCKAG
jgi:hypothetical protein